MNLIANRHLDGAQKQVIYELTLKKRQSKKSTMSDRHRAAKQQLAKELMLERIIPISLGSISSQHTIDSFAISANSTSDSMSHADQQSLLNELLTQSNNSSPSTGGNTCQTCCCTIQIANNSNSNSNSNNSSHLAQQQQQTLNTTTLAQQQQLIDSPPMSGFIHGSGAAPSSRLSCASCSFTRSDSSYSGSSASITTANSSNSGNQRHNVQQSHNNGTHLMIENDNNENDDKLSSEARKKEASIKVHKLKLEHLNFELGRRLHQYEYLVAQEKALLGTYNMLLFTNQGVNNFHLHRDI